MPEAIHEEASGRWFRPGGIIMMITGAVLLVAAVPLASGPDSPLGSLAGPLLEPLLVALFSLVFLLIFVGAMLNSENRNRIILTADELRVGKEVFPTSELVLPLYRPHEVEANVGPIFEVARVPWLAVSDNGRRFVGGSRSRTWGQKVLAVTHEGTGEVLLIGSWRGYQLCDRLERLIAPQD